MKVIADFSLIPIGVGVSLSPYIAQCEKILKEFKLELNLHSYGTNIQGEWDEVMAAINKCHKVLHAQGVPRITTSIKLGTRIDKDQHMADKVKSVRQKI